MSEVITNMKVRFGADTKQFKKGMNDGKRSVQNFKKDAGSALESFANQFGVSLGPLSGILNKSSNATKALSSSMKTGATSTGIFSKALKLFKLALISTGIGAIIVALGSLISYFTNTQRGADKVSKVLKSIGAVTDVLVDHLSAFGETIVKAFSDPKQAVADLWDAIKTNIVNRFEGLILLFQKVGAGLKALWSRDLEGLKVAAKEAGEAVIQITTGLDADQQKKVANSIKGVATEIREEAKAAGELEAARQKLERREIEFIKTKQRLAAEISDLILLTRDENISGQERLKYIEEAQKLQKQLSTIELSIASERARILKEQQALGENMISDDRELAEAEALVNTKRKEGNDKLRELVNRYTEMTNKINASTKAILTQREALKDFKPMESKSATVVASVKLDTTTLAEDIIVAENIIVDFGKSFENTFEGLAVSFGESMGNLLAGTGGFDDFGKVILGSLGDLAIQLGKIAIQTGITMKSIKLSFNSPGTAIAAGVALVALGTLVKSSISSAMSGIGGGGGSISDNSGVYDTRTDFGSTRTPIAQAQPVAVHLTGEFTQRGSEMVATINETNRQNGYRG